MPSLFCFAMLRVGRFVGPPEAILHRQSAGPPPRVSLGASRHRAAMHHLKCVVDAALDGREDAHEGVVVVAIVVVGDLRETHE